MMGARGLRVRFKDVENVELVVLCGQRASDLTTDVIGDEVQII
jgi:hypothetical protein